jgi:hypothetical protein
VVADHAWSGVEFRTDAVYIYRDPEDAEMSRFGALRPAFYIAIVAGLLGLVLWIGYHAFTKG